MKIMLKKVKLYDFTDPLSNAADEQVGKQTPIAVRFSTVGGESGSADTARCQKRSQSKDHTEKVLERSQRADYRELMRDHREQRTLPKIKITEHHRLDKEHRKISRMNFIFFYCHYGILTTRDPRGFAVKFYTEEGNWDIVGNNTPIFFIR